MKHEAQKSNHLTITQLLCEQISIIPNLSKWNLEQLNRLENSVPQQQQGITSMRGWRREGEKTSMSAISGRVPKSMDHPPQKKTYLHQHPCFILQVTEFCCPNKGMKYTFCYSQQSALRWQLIKREASFSPMCSHTISTCLRMSFHLLYSLPPDLYIKNQSHFQLYHQASTSWYNTSLYHLCPWWFLKILSVHSFGTWNM